MKLNKLFTVHTLTIIIVIFIIFVSYYLFNTSFLESFSSSPTIILLGDSILNNSNYVPIGESIYDYLQSLNKNNMHIYNYAKNESIITDTIYQLNSVPLINDNNNLHIIISAGGNNILQKNNINPNDLFSELVHLIQTIQTKFPNAKISIINLYVPTNQKYIIVKSIIEQWNNLLQTNKSKYNYNIIDLYTLLNSPSDFISDYEPSPSASKKIANLIYLTL